MTIKDVRAIEVLDSRGKPTVRAFVFLNSSIYSSSSVPSGASTGSYEAVELRDQNKNRYQGNGVTKAVDNINTTIKKILKGKSADPRSIDRLLIAQDGTKNKSRLGANAILAVSQALIRAVAQAENLPLWQYINQYYFNHPPKFPRLMVNIINGGKHADWSFDIQEFMISPCTRLPSKSVRVASEIFYQLGQYLKSLKLSLLVGDEGGYAPALSSNERCFSTIIKAANQLNYKNGVDFQLAIDAAASEFYENGSYLIKKTKKKLSGLQLINFYKKIRKRYRVFSFEDPFAEDDWDSFAKLTQVLNRQALVIGDDLYVTNKTRIKRGVDKKATNAVLIKPNQIGTILETIEAINLAKQANWAVAISHRSGETEDPFIADLAFACGADFLKAGSMSRSERLTKYNRLLEIEVNLPI